MNEPQAPQTTAPSGRPRTPESGEAVLALSVGQVEWAERDRRGVCRYGRAVPEDASPRALVEAARAAREAAGGSARRIALLLGGGLVEERLVQLPALPRKRLREVFARRAAQWVQGEALWAALELGAEAKEGGSAWLLVSAPKQRTLELFGALTAAGWSPQRAQASPLAQLGAALGGVEDLDGGTIVVAVEPDQVVVSLVADGRRLVLQSVLAGDLSRSVSLGASLVHELRSMESHWRKHHHGRSVRQVALLGLAASRAQVLAHTLAGVLPDAVVRQVANNGSEGDEARGNALLLARGRHPFQLDLWGGRSRAQARRRLATALSALVVLISAQVFLDQRHANLALTEEVALLRRSVADEAELVHERAQARAAVEAFVARVDTVVAAHSQGFALARPLADLQRAFQGTAQLSSLHLDSSGVRVVGRALGAPVPALRGLTLSARRLEAEPWAAGIQMAPGPDGVERGQGVSFEMNLGWRRAGDAQDQ